MSPASKLSGANEAACLCVSAWRSLLLHFLSSPWCLAVLAVLAVHKLDMVHGFSPSSHQQHPLQLSISPRAYMPLAFGNLASPNRLHMRTEHGTHHLRDESTSKHPTFSSALVASVPVADATASWQTPASWSEAGGWLTSQNCWDKIRWIYWHMRSVLRVCAMAAGFLPCPLRWRQPH